jgi:hypothetical protein
MTRWYRPIVSELLADGVEPDAGPVWRLDRETGRYRELDAAGAPVA